MALNISNISYSYSENVPVLKDVSLFVAKGEVVALIGESGSGKSTLLHIASGYITPTLGTVSLLGEAVRAPNVNCTVMFQDDYLYPWLSVFNNIRIGVKITKKSVPNSYINQLIDILGLGELRDKMPHALSGGQRQRVAFARSLALSPAVFALDEPFSALDPYTRGMLQTLIRKTVLQMNASLLLVSHSIEEVVKMADRVLILKNGVIDSSFEIALTQDERRDDEIVKVHEKYIHRAVTNGLKKENKNVQILYHI